MIMQDFTGVPCVVDLAAMREAIARLGGDPAARQPAAPAELVIDHSVQVDEYGTADALRAQQRASSSSATASATCSCAGARPPSATSRSCRPTPASSTRSTSSTSRRVVFDARSTATHRAYPDTLVGTDSHTTMVNGLGVLGWGVGGIEAEAAMLGQPVTMLIPQVIGFKLPAALPAGTTATDLVLTVTEMLRKKGVVDKFVEFFGDGLAGLPLADRATIANMSPEYGATCAIFPIDEETLRYLRLTGRSAEQVALVEAYAQGAGPVAHRRRARGRVHRRARARPRDGRAVARRPEAPAGPRAAARGEGASTQARGREDAPRSARARTRRRPAARRSTTAASSSSSRTARC